MQAKPLWSMFLLTASALPLAAQDREIPLAPAPPGTMRITVTLIQVDAVVTDSHGRHIADLRPEDFELLQDAVPQKITYFSYIPETPPLARPELAAKPRRGIDKLPLGPPPPVSATQVRRTIALVVDDLTLSWSSTVRVRESLRKYVEQQMQPGDLVAIVRTRGGVAFLEQFTTDRRLLLEAVDLLKWSYNGRCCFGSITPVRDGPGATPDAPEILDYGEGMAALGALGTMESIIRGMKKLPGRKSILFLSESMRLGPRISSSIDRLTDLANRSAVSIYAVDPTGLKMDPTFSADSSSDIGGGLLEALSADRYGYDPLGGLDYLSRKTGGLFFYNNNDIPGCIRQAAEDQLGYYLLGYSPQEGTFEEDAARARFHKLTVRVRRPGVTVRWKTGFSGVPDALVEVDPGLPKTRERQLMEALASPFTATGLKVRLTSQYYDTVKDGPVVLTWLHFEGKDLEFKKGEDGVWSAMVDLVTSAYRGSSAKQTFTVHQGERRQPIHLPDDLYEKARKEGFLYRFLAPMKEPGTFLMRAVVRDAGSERIGSASQMVKVPDTRKGQLAMSGVALQTVPPEMLKTLKFAPPPAERNAEPWTEGGPATRRYRPGQSLMWSYMLVNPKVKKPGRMPEVTSYVRLFRNGSLVFTSEPKPLLPEGRLDDRHFLNGGVLHFSLRHPPGEYLLQVIVTDKNQKKKNRVIAEWADFEVVRTTPPVASNVAPAR